MVDNLVYLVVFGGLLALSTLLVMLASKLLWGDRDASYGFLILLSFGVFDFTSDCFLIYTLGESLAELPELALMYYLAVAFLATYSIIMLIVTCFAIRRAAMFSTKMKW